MLYSDYELDYDSDDSFDWYSVDEQSKHWGYSSYESSSPPPTSITPPPVHQDRDDMLALFRELKASHDRQNASFSAHLDKQHTIIEALHADCLSKLAALEEQRQARAKLKTMEEQKHKEPPIRKPNAKRVKSSSSVKSRPSKHLPRTKVIPPHGLYAFSATIRRFREVQLWFGIEPYFDRRQTLSILGRCHTTTRTESVEIHYNRLCFRDSGFSYCDRADCQGRCTPSYNTLHQKICHLNS